MTLLPLELCVKFLSKTLKTFFLPFFFILLSVPHFENVIFTISKLLVGIFESIFPAAQHLKSRLWELTSVRKSAIFGGRGERIYAYTHT